MEEGNKAHGLTDYEMRRWKEERGITFMIGWPLSSSDFNPIENVQRLLKQRLKAREPFTSLDALKQVLLED